MNITSILVNCGAKYASNEVMLLKNTMKWQVVEKVLSPFAGAGSALCSPAARPSGQLRCSRLTAQSQLAESSTCPDSAARIKHLRAWFACDPSLDRASRVFLDTLLDERRSNVHRNRPHVRERRANVTELQDPAMNFSAMFGNDRMMFIETTAMLGKR